MTAAVHSAVRTQPALEPAVKARPLRFITCGNVDDGKSTLIGRLLWDTKMVMSDHVAGLYRGRNAGQHADNDGLNLPDFSLLLDGLQAEREQGITIDVAYRYFSTATRSYIVADTPGHEQYTGNMATGASTADLAIVLVDARAGLQDQTRRHLMIVSLMGIRNVVLVVNKMDLVGYDRQTFQAIADAFTTLTGSLALDEVTIIPTSAPQGENVTVPASHSMPWYNGPTLLEALESADVADDVDSGFRLSVQRVSRPDESFRGYQGTVTGGAVEVGDAVTLAPSGQQAVVARIVTFDGDRQRAEPGDAVTLTLDRNVDVARGDMIAAAGSGLASMREIEAKLVVLTSEGLDPSKRYWLKAGGRRQRVRLEPQRTLSLKDYTWSDAGLLEHNTIATGLLRFDEEAVFDLYSRNRASGSFILIDPDTLSTVAGGMVTGLTGRKDRSTNRSGATATSQTTVTLNLPLDLARDVLGSDLLQKRIGEVEVLQIERETLSAAHPLVRSVIA